jgi:hypothetical protein
VRENNSEKLAQVAQKNLNNDPPVWAAKNHDLKQIYSERRLAATREITCWGNDPAQRQDLHHFKDLIGCEGKCTEVMAS